MKRLILLLVVALGLFGLATSVASAAPGPKPPPAAPASMFATNPGTVAKTSGPAGAAATSIVAEWEVWYGGGYTNNPPTVYTNRNPTWFTGTNPGLTFTTGGDFQDSATFCANGHICWHTGTSPTLPAMLRWARDCNQFIQGALHDVPWATNVDLTDSCAGTQILWSNGCLNSYWWDGYQWRVGWKNSDNPACAILI